LKQQPLVGAGRIKTAVIILEPGKHAEFGNAHALELFGARNTTELNEALLAPEHGLDSELERAAGEPQEKVIKLAGRAIHLQITCSGRGWVIVAHDLAELRALQQWMKAASVQRARERMSGTLLHSVKSPMHAITLALDVLRKTLPPETESRARHYLETIGKDLHRLNESLEAVLSDTRPLNEPAQVDLSALISEIATMMRVEAAMREVSLKLDLAEQTTTIIGRRHELKHVLAAMLLNALDASAEGSEVEIKLTREDHWARITISGANALPGSALDHSIDLEVAREIAREYGGEFYADSSRRTCFKLPLKEQE
jgi:signal transduction histidine kinase